MANGEFKERRACYYNARELEPLFENLMHRVLDEKLTKQAKKIIEECSQLDEVKQLKCEAFQSYKALKWMVVFIAVPVITRIIYLLYTQVTG